MGKEEEEEDGKKSERGREICRKGILNSKEEREAFVFFLFPSSESAMIFFLFFLFFFLLEIPGFEHYEGNYEMGKHCEEGKGKKIGKREGKG